MDNYYIIGVGASAGGLEAISEFLNHFPKELNVTIVITQHLSPNYKSRMVALLAKESPFEVIEIVHGQKVLPRKVYITPPDNDLTIKDQVFELSRPHVYPGPKPSVDLFFQSLAEQMQDRAIAVILSGTGTDGANGIRAIKAKGGITIVQDPFTAKYDGMPIAAIETGNVDLVLPADKIGEELKEVIKNPKSLLMVTSEINEDSKSLTRLFYLLSKRTGTDFSNYKPATILRRLVKRLEMLKINTLREYVDFIESNPKELDMIFNMILIGVTEFFRDPDAFLELEKYLSKIISSKTPGENIRIWAPGSSSGEEAYSIAILLSKLLKEKILNYNIQIFATDIDEKAIAIARKGSYSAASLDKVPPQIISEYFIKNGNNYELIKPIRSLVLFSRHDITSNPPFLKLDLICCRNLLIYFSTNLQKQIFPIFHYALNPDGYLFLGKSETIGQFTDLFVPIDNKYKIFQKRRTSSLNPIRLSHFKPSRRITPLPEKTPKQASNSEIVKETLFHTYEFPYVLINENMDLIEIFGDVTPYLGLSQGIMNSNIIKLAIKDIQIELRSAITKAIKERTRVKTNIRKIEENSVVRYVRIQVIPAMLTENDMYIVIFESVNKEEFLYKEPSEKESSENPRILELEQELTATRVHLQTFIEELETSNEELQSLNEELMSTNEELQSSNEELETSNEELQSTNEELNIAYAELKAANELLEKQGEKLRISEANATALLNNTQQIFYLIDKNYRIIIYNKTASEKAGIFFKRILKVGDSIIDYIPAEDLETFQKDFQKALKGDIIQAEKVNIDPITGSKIWFAYSLTPIQGQNGIEMISYSLSDITELKNVQMKHKKSELILNSVFEHIKVGIGLLDKNDFHTKVNKSYLEICGYSLDEILGKPFNLIFLQENNFTGNYEKKETRLLSKNGTTKDILLSKTSIQDEESNIFTILTIQDISDQKKREEELRYKLEREKLIKNIINKFINFVTSEMNVLNFAEDKKLSSIKETMLLNMEEEFEQLRPKFYSFKTKALLEDIKFYLKNDFPSEYTRFKFNFSYEVEDIYIDKSLLLQVFYHLLSNSVNYSFPETDIEISLFISTQQMKIEIQDSGIGISEEELPLVFELFYRGQNALSIKGIGLGLKIVKNIIKKLNGNLKLESKLKNFTKVSLEIPLSKN